MFKAGGKPNAKAQKEAQEAERKRKAAIRIQCLVRKALASVTVRKRAFRIWRKVFDPASKIYFWYNQLNAQSQWNLPKYMKAFTEDEENATMRIQRIVRGFTHRMRARKKAHSMYTRFYDSNVNKFYWMINETQVTFWKSTSWLLKQEIPMPPEDEMLYQSVLRIKELEAMLKKKDDEIKGVRLQRYEELEPQILVDRVKSAKDLERSKDMDDWTIDELAAFFTEMKMDQYIPFLYSNRVDGYLFVNLKDNDWADMGIVSKFHQRKLQLIMRQFRYRFQKKKNRGDAGEDDEEDEDELMSEYAPSELSEILRQEELSDEEDPVKKQQIALTIEGDDVSEEEAVGMTLEERLQRQEDDRNISLQIIAYGDGEHYPLVGDIVRCRYTCSLPDGKQVLSSKHSIGRLDGVEFVIGLNQVIKGIDRALPRMSIGEKSMITISPEYAYGKEGLFPLIPPDSPLIFELTLLSFHQRPIWVKPLLQEPGLSQKPYMESKHHSTATVGKK